MMDIIQHLLLLCMYFHITDFFCAIFTTVDVLCECFTVDLEVIGLVLTTIQS